MKTAFAMLAALILMVFMATASEGIEGSNRVKFRGKYFVSIEGDAGTTPGDVILFPQKKYGIETFVTDPDSSTAVTTVRVTFEVASSIILWGDAFPGGSMTFVSSANTHAAFPATEWFVGFKGGVDSLQIFGTAVNCEYIIWGMI